MRFAAFSGLRAGEVAALRLGRVAVDGSWVEVAESVVEVHGLLVYGAPKTYTRRRVDLPAGLADEIATHRATRPPDAEEFLFTGPTGGALRHSNFFRRFYKPAVVRAELDPRTRFHDLRHTAAAPLIA